MNFDAIRNAIENRFLTNWSATPVAWPNVPFPPPATAWVRLSLLDGQAGNETLANGVAYPGVIDIGVLVPESAGAGQARTLADQAAAIFNNQRFGGVACRAAYATVIGAADGWWRMTVTVPFTYR